MTETMTLFFALLALGGMAVVIGTGVLRVTAPTSALLRDLTSIGMWLGFTAATVATAGSLYLSEIVGFDPCRLCWVQRAFMYPSALLLAVALFAKQRWAAWVAVGLSVVGFCVSVYHRLEQQYPDSVGGACAIDNPCSGRYVEEFGWITIPTMAAVAFALVFTLVPLNLRAART